VLRGGHTSDSARNDANLYADRNKVERLIGRMKPFRRVYARYDKTATRFLAFVHVASAFVLLA
jgi:transposase